MKEFFTKKPVMIVESILLVLGAVGLTISGVGSEGVQSMASLAVAGISGIDAIATFITALVSKKAE